MKKILFTLLLLSNSLFALEWAKDITTALSVAQKEHKLVMVFVESETCRWCKKMKYRTFSDETVQKRLEPFVVVKVMKEDAEAMSHVPPVKGAPTTFFIKENKEVVLEVLGYFDVEDFLDYIVDVQSPVK